VGALDKLANVSIIFVCCAIGADVIQRRMSAAPAAAPSPSFAYSEYKSGETVEIPGFARQADRPSLLFIVKSTCPYCTRSMPFYEQVARQFQGTGSIQLVGVCTEPDDACAKYFDEHGVKLDATVGVAANAVKIRGTPTLVLVNDNGTVKEVWPGELDAARQALVLAAIDKARKRS